MGLRKTAILAGLAAVLAGGAAPAEAQIAPPMDGYNVEVSFSKSLNRKMDAINRVEQIREERFRRNRIDERSPIRTIQRHARIELRNVGWAGEALIPELENYTVENLIRAFTADNINRAMPGFRGSIHYEIKRFKVDDHSVALLSGSHTYITGRIEVRDASGAVIADTAVSSELVVDPTVDWAYDGPKYAFAETDESDRVGPALSYFVEDALESVWPDKRDAVHGPILVRITGPNEAIFQ